MSYDATSLQPVSVLNVTPSGQRAGIWQAGRGLAADGTGNIFLMTGNGTVSGQDFGMSFLRLTPDLQVADRFLPGNHACLNQADLDLGSSGPLVLQSSAPGRSPDLLVGGGKEGNLYLFNSLSLGTPLSEVVATAPPEWFGVACHAFVKSGGSDTHHIHSGPALWDVNGDGSTRLLYVMGENDNLKAFQVTFNNQLVKIAWSKFRAFVGMPGGALSVSYSTDPSSALVWASVPVADATKEIVRGMLIAFQAAPNGTDIPLLWHSEMVPARDSVGLYSKFAPPTVADERVFVASFGDPNFVDPTGKHNEDWLRPGALNMYGFLNRPFRGRRRLPPGINKIPTSNPPRPAPKKTDQ